MTYKQLLELLQSLSEQQLKMIATVSLLNGTTFTHMCMDTKGYPIIYAHHRKIDDLAIAANMR